MIDLLKEIEFEPFLISFKLAGITTLILFFISLPLAWYLSQTKSKIKPLLEAITALPLVLPPSVLGFYILWALSYNSPIGAFFEEYFGIKLVFNFYGLIIASCFYSLPFMVQPMQSGLESLNKNMLEASYISGKSRIETLFRIALPNMKPSLITAIIVTFAHTVGEFGVVLMVGGSIPGETKVASVAIYEFVEIMDYTNAHIYSVIMVILSFLTLLGVYIFNGKQKKLTGLDR
jgi:molybdate transport system permease protein